MINKKMAHHIDLIQKWKEMAKQEEKAMKGVTKGTWDEGVRECLRNKEDLTFYFY